MALEITVGQRFQEADRPVIWEVEALLERPGEPPHARLHRVDDRFRLKTIAQAALRDQNLYVPQA